MDTLTFMHTADLHLGTAFKGFPPQTGRERRKELAQALTTIVDLCLRQEANLLLIAGDLWDQDYITRPLVEFVADQFRRMPQVQVVIAPGESDSYWQGSFYSTYLWPNNVNVFSRSSISSFSFPQLGVRVHGFAWTGSTPPAPDWTALDLDASSVNIILAHGTTEDLGINQDLLTDSRIKYIGLGHAHKHSQLAPGVVYSGSPEPLSFDDEGRLGAVLGKISIGTLHTDFIPLARRQYISLPVEIVPENTLEQTAEQIRQLVAPFEPETNLFQLQISGSNGGQWTTNQLAALLPTLWYCSLQGRAGPEYDLEALSAEYGDSVVGHYIRQLQLRAKEGSGHSELIDRALTYGLDALLTKEVRIW